MATTSAEHEIDDTRRGPRVMLLASFLVVCGSQDPLKRYFGGRFGAVATVGEVNVKYPSGYFVVSILI